MKLLIKKDTGQVVSCSESGVEYNPEFFIEADADVDLLAEQGRDLFWVSGKVESRERILDTRGQNQRAVYAKLVKDLDTVSDLENVKRVFKDAFDNLAK